MAKKRKYALALSGGGFKGVFQVGALQYLIENGISHPDGTTDPAKFDIIVGVSVGSLNGALLAMDKFPELVSLWDKVEKNGSSEIFTSELLDIQGSKLNLNFGNVVKKLLPQGIFSSIFRLIFSKQKLIDSIGENLKQIKSVASNQPLADKLKVLVKKEFFKPEVAFKAGFVSLVDGLYHAHSPEEFATDDDLQKAVLASTAMPIVWAPVPEIRLKDGTLFKHSIDGGVRNVSPLGDVVDFINAQKQPDEEYYVIIINNDRPDPVVQDKDFFIGSTAVRALTDLTLEEIYTNDVNTFTAINDIISQAQTQKPDVQLLKPDGITAYQSFHYKIIRPNNPHELGDTLDTSPEILKLRKQKGFEAAKAAMESLSQFWV